MKIKVKLAQRETKEVKITTENIRLDAALKLASAISTGGQAKMIIQDSLVKVNGEICTSRGKKLNEGDTFEFEKKIYKIVK
ncbi:MAG: RNA-binding S4 domain-containing protein [Clostridia bacterium]|nr:RNA-binding S4 domain-containing protein [Clostridia bacterium]